MTKLKAGQKIWVLENERGKSNIIETTISKVGKKYFEVNGLYRSRFVIDNLEIDSIYNSKTRCYLDINHFYNEVKTREIIRQIRNYFSSYAPIDLSLESLQIIKDLIDNRNVKPSTTTPGDDVAAGHGAC